MAKNFYLLNKTNDPEKENEKIVESISNNFPEQDKILLFGEVQSGKTNNLINILVKLFEEDKIDFVFYITGNTTNLKEQNFERFYSALPSHGIKLVDSDITFLRNEINSETNKGKVVITVIKQYIKQMKNFISKNLKGRRVLIIDDEADEYSNSNANSKIFTELISEKVSLISCTATPFVNLYENENMYDSFYQLIPWNGYHGRKSFEENKIILPEGLSKVNVYGYALLDWARTIYLNNLENGQILFNIDNANEVHKEVKKDIFEICEEIIQFPEDYKINYESKGKEINIEEAIKIIKLAMNKGIKVLNRRENDTLKNEGYEIIIGGILLSRGITYENLITELFFNMGEKTKAHTLVQRARWFGYRKSNKSLIKIYMEEKVNEAFTEVEQLYEVTLDHELHGEILYKDKINELKKNWERITL